MNPGLRTQPRFSPPDPEGFLVGELGGPVSVSSRPFVMAATARIHRFHVVKPAFRGSGHGWAIWQTGDGPSGRPHHRPRRRRRATGQLSPLRLELAHRNAATPGRQSAGGPARHRPWRWCRSVSCHRACWTRPAVFPGRGTSLLQAWVTQPDTWSRSRRRATALLGYGVLRPCRTGYKIGPLFADAPAIAEAIFSALLQHVPAGERSSGRDDQPNHRGIATSTVCWSSLKQRACISGAAPAISPIAPMASPV